MSSRARVQPQQRQGGGGMLLLLLAMLVGVFLCLPALAGVEQAMQQAGYSDRSHADERHGSAVVDSILAQEARAGIRDRFRCPDDRIRTAVFFPDGRVAMTVRNSIGELITAFLTDTRYLSRELAPCRSESDRYPFFVPLEDRN